MNIHMRIVYIRLKTIWVYVQILLCEAELNAIKMEQYYQRHPELRQKSYSWQI
jgi:hypothetical protein